MPTNDMWPLPCRRATLDLAKRLALALRGGDLVILSGELGAGKTFLTRGICRALGLSERIRVTSPTFTLVHEYATTPPLLHADLYRLNEVREVRPLDLFSRREEGAALLVEWGEPFVDELGGDALTVRLKAKPRAAEFSATGDRSARMLAQVLDSRQKTPVRPFNRVPHE